MKSAWLGKERKRIRFRDGLVALFSIPEPEKGPESNSLILEPSAWEHLNERQLAMFIALVLFVQSVVAAQAQRPAHTSWLLSRSPGGAVLSRREGQVHHHPDRGGAPAAQEVKYQLDKDGMPPVSRGTAQLENGTASVEAALAEPGFLTCRVTYRRGTEASDALAGAGIDPTKIPPSRPVPEDFDAFWAKHKEALRAAPMDLKLTSVDSCRDGIEAFEVQISCPGWKPVSAYLAKPRARPRAACPSSCRFMARACSAPFSARPEQRRELQGPFHGPERQRPTNGKPDQFYQELAGGELKGYPSIGRDDREKGYFLGMFLRLVRAMDYLTSQDEWDGKHLIVIGSSQGGGQSIAAAGLEPRVTLICPASRPSATTPAKSRPGQWLAAPCPRRRWQARPQDLQVARYFDCMNFATRAKAEAVFSVGFIDTTCPPPASTRVQRHIGKKQIVTEPLMGHNSSAKISKAHAEAIESM